MGLAHDGREFRAGERVLPEYFGEAGYETHLFGLQHLTARPDRPGHDRIHADDTLTPEADPALHEGARARDVATAVAGWIDDGGMGGEAPAFASIGFCEAHRVEEGGGFGSESDRYDTPPPGDVEPLPLPLLPDEPGIRSAVAGIHGMVEAIDEGIGTIRDALEAAAPPTRSSSSRRTTGWPSRGRRGCYDAGIEAALLLQYPDAIDPQMRDELVSDVDVFATLLEFVDVPVHADVSGRSFAPLLAPDRFDREYEPRDRIFAGMPGTTATTRSGRSARTGTSTSGTSGTCPRSS